METKLIQMPKPKDISKSLELAQNSEGISIGGLCLINHDYFIHVKSNRYASGSTINLNPQRKFNIGWDLVSRRVNVFSVLAKLLKNADYKFYENCLIISIDNEMLHKEFSFKVIDVASTDAQFAQKRQGFCAKTMPYIKEQCINPKFSEDFILFFRDFPLTGDCFISAIDSMQDEDYTAEELQIMRDAAKKHRRTEKMFCSLLNAGFNYDSLFDLTIAICEVC